MWVQTTYVTTVTFLKLKFGEFLVFMLAETSQSVIIKDPTENVLQVLDAAVKRLDDLRLADQERIGIQLDYIRQLSNAESLRLNAIREIDVAAIATASGKADSVAALLASQVASSAEALKVLVTTTADARAHEIDDVTRTLKDRLEKLEESKNKAVGKSSVSDPMRIALTVAITGIIVFVLEKLMGLIK